MSELMKPMVDAMMQRKVERVPVQWGGMSSIWMIFSRLIGWGMCHNQNYQSFRK